MFWVVIFCKARNVPSQPVYVALSRSIDKQIRFHYKLASIRNYQEADSITGEKRLL